MGKCKLYNHAKEMRELLHEILKDEVRGKNSYYTGGILVPRRKHFRIHGKSFVKISDIKKHFESSLIKQSDKTGEKK